MRTIKIALAFIIMLTSTVMFAQKQEVNTSKSSVKWIGEKIVGQHDGTIKLKSAFLEVKNKQIVSGEFVIDMKTITNTDLEDKGYSQKLVDHLNSDDFFGVEKFPTAKFVVKSSTKFKNGKATITGDITIKGKTKSITFDASKDGANYIATVKIDRSKFDIRYGSSSFFDNLGNKAIGDIFTLNIKLVVS